MIGVNDLAFHSAGKVIVWYDELINLIKNQAPETQLIIQSILPVNTSIRNYGAQNAAIQRVNQYLQKVTRDRGIPYVDLSGMFQDETGNLKAAFTDDGLHINGEGYIVWKEAIISRVER